MSIWNMAFLALVVSAFVAFMVVLMSVNVSLMLFDAKRRKADKAE